MRHTLYTFINSVLLNDALHAIDDVDSLTGVLYTATHKVIDYGSSLGGYLLYRDACLDVTLNLPNYGVVHSIDGRNPDVERTVGVNHFEVIALTDDSATRVGDIALDVVVHIIKLRLLCKIAHLVLLEEVQAVRNVLRCCTQRDRNLFASRDGEGVPLLVAIGIVLQHGILGV